MIRSTTRRRLMLRSLIAVGLAALTLGAQAQTYPRAR